MVSNSEYPSNSNEDSYHEDLEIVMCIQKGNKRIHLRMGAESSDSSSHERDEYLIENIMSKGFIHPRSMWMHPNF